MEKSAICGLRIFQLTVLYSFSVTEQLSPSDGLNLLMRQIDFDLLVCTKNEEKNLKNCYFPG